MSAEEVLAQVAKEVAACEKCTLYHSRKNSVPGEGPADSEIMFIGEGPGFYENEQGRPFVGASGQFLDQLLAQAGLKRIGCFDRQCGQMQTARQSRSVAGGVGSVRCVS